MKKMLVILLLFLVQSSFCQETVETYDSEQFVFQVKQIDEFIERFNNTDHTLIKQYLEERYDLEVSRKDLVLSLFDVSNITEQDKQHIAKFIQDVTDSKKPPYLSFYDSDWYAKVNCLAEYKGTDVTFDITLATKVSKDKKAVNWAVKSLNLSAIDLVGNFNFSTLLPPSGHGTNFLELQRLFSYPKNYYDTSEPKDNLMNQLLLLAESGEFKFKRVKSVSYHFLQLEHWIVKVEEFERKEKNSGWLISELHNASDEEKQNYLMHHLYIE